MVQTLHHCNAIPTPALNFNISRWDLWHFQNYYAIFLLVTKSGLDRVLKWPFVLDLAIEGGFANVINRLQWQCVHREAQTELPGFELSYVRWEDNPCELWGHFDKITEIWWMSEPLACTVDLQKYLRLCVLSKRREGPVEWSGVSPSALERVIAEKTV